MNNDEQKDELLIEAGIDTNTVLPVSADVDTNTVLPVSADVEQFWRGIICNEDGTIDEKKVMAELSDFRFIINQLPKVYCHITNNKLSKHMYPAETVIAVADDSYREHYLQVFKDAIGDMQIDGVISEKIKNKLLGNIEKFV